MARNGAAARAWPGSTVGGARVRLQGAGRAPPRPWRGGFLTLGRGDSALAGPGPLSTQSLPSRGLGPALPCPSLGKGRGTLSSFTSFPNRQAARGPFPFP